MKRDLDFTIRGQKIWRSYITDELPPKYSCFAADVALISKAKVRKYTKNEIWCTVCNDEPAIAEMTINNNKISLCSLHTVYRSCDFVFDKLCSGVYSAKLAAKNVPQVSIDADLNENYFRVREEFCKINEVSSNLALNLPLNSKPQCDLCNNRFGLCDCQVFAFQCVIKTLSVYKLLLVESIGCADIAIKIINLWYNL